MLGKRSRPSMRRTTSMSVLSDDSAQPSDHEFPPGNEKERSAPPPPVPVSASAAERKKEVMGSVKNGRKAQKSRRAASVDGNVDKMGMVPSESAPLVMASFLRACGLCKKKLGPGKDTFMYRGEIAFCSLECRGHQIAIDERKDKCSLSSMKKTPSQATTGTKPSNGFNTAAA